MSEKPSVFVDISNIKAPDRASVAFFAAPETEKIEVRKDMIPEGAKLVEAYLTEKEVIVCGMPKSDDESHNCDQMGCSSLSHVIHRFSLDDSRERKTGDERKAIYWLIKSYIASGRNVWEEGPKEEEVREHIVDFLWNRELQPSLEEHEKNVEEFLKATEAMFDNLH